MNPSETQRFLGNLCVGVAAVLYAFPLQYLLLELSRKRNDGGSGVLAGLSIIVPLWLLLMIALLCVTASGGFNGLRLNRWVLYVLTVLATVAMAITSTFLRFELPLNPGFLDRVIGVLPMHLFPVLTMLLVILSLNPRLAMGLPLQIVSLPWTILAAVNLAVCGGFVGYQLLVAGGRQVAGFGHTFRWASAVNQGDLARIPALDPQSDFAELTRLTDEFHSRAVRDAALAQLRRNPDFVATLVAELTGGSVTNGSADHALDVVGYATFTPEEQMLLALPARTAMERITTYIRSEFRYFTKDRRKATRQWGSRVFEAVAAKLASTGVDFRPAIEAFEQTFDNPSATAN